MTAGDPGYDPRAGRYVGGAAFGLPAPAMPAVDAAQLELLVRFEHPAKFLAVKELPGAALLPDACQAAAYGTSPEQLAHLRDRLWREARDAAGELAADPATRAAIRRLPVRAGGTLVALGDSITDDSQSWAEILRHCLEEVRPGEVTLVNAGLSGDTTADALGRLYGIVELRPELVVAMLGTNDCQRHGPGGARLVSERESAENVTAISAWLEAAGTHVVWLTPPPVDEAALARAVAPRPLAVRAADVLALAGALRAAGHLVLDAGSRLSGRVADGHLLADGLHPSLAGHIAIARGVLTGLAALAPAPTSSDRAATPS